MSYTVDTPLRSIGVFSEAQWTAHILSTFPLLRGSDFYFADPTNVREVVREYMVQAPTYHKNFDQALAQWCHETGFGTSQKWHENLNPAGLGATNDGAVGAIFSNLSDAVAAHYQHLCCYADSAATCPVEQGAVALHDTRHWFHDGMGTWNGLIQPTGHRWAFPGKGYVEALVKIANDAGARSVRQPPPTGAPMNVPYDRIHTSADYGPTRPLNSINWITIHDTEGSFPGDEQVLTSPAAPVESVTFLIGREPGQCVYVVPLNMTAWTSGNVAYDQRAINFELSKRPTEQGYTEYQIAKLVDCILWSRQEGVINVPFIYLGLHPLDADGGWLPDNPGILGHAGVPDGSGGWGGFAHHTDPGPSFPWDDVIARLNGSATAPQPPVDERRFPETGQRIIGGFKAFYEENDGEHRLGFPIADEEHYDDATCQIFERGMLKLLPDGTVEYAPIGKYLARLLGRHGLGID